MRVLHLIPPALLAIAPRASIRNPTINKTVANGQRMIRKPRKLVLGVDPETLRLIEINRTPMSK
jgi:hypothetical protein